MRWRAVTNVTNTFNITPVVVGPDDRVVLSLPEHVTTQQVSALRDVLMDALGGDIEGRVIVIGGADVVVMRGAA